MHRPLTRIVGHETTDAPVISSAHPKTWVVQAATNRLGALSDRHRFIIPASVSVTTP